MFTLIKQAHVYDPEDKGINDVLITGTVIARIAERIDLPPEFGAQSISAAGKIVTPGFVDLHVHLLGGGGEAGPRTRTPEITLSKITRAGVTTVVGCLGTDDVTRRPENLLAKAMQLEAEGISAYMYTGSYQFPPPTVTGSVRKDIALIPKIIGVGEIAVSDHRSSQPSVAELCRVAAEARVGGMIAGKAGLVHLHMGSGRRGLEPILRIVEETEIPIGQFLPTHVTRSEALLEQCIGFAKMGGNLDLTVSGPDLSFPIPTAKALRQILKEGVPIDQLSLSSDSNGSMPIFDAQGNVVELAVGDIGFLHREIQTLAAAGFELPQVLKLVTANPARRTGLSAAKGSLAVGKDADLVVMDADLNIDSVIARGRLMVHQKRVRVKGTFEA